MGKHGLDGRRRNIVGQVGEEFILNVGGGVKWKEKEKKDWGGDEKAEKGRIGNIFFSAKSRCVRPSAAREIKKSFYSSGGPPLEAGMELIFHCRGGKRSILGSNIRNGEKWKKITFFTGNEQRDGVGNRVMSLFFRPTTSDITDFSSSPTVSV